MRPTHLLAPLALMMLLAPALGYAQTAPAGPPPPPSAAPVTPVTPVTLAPAHPEIPQTPAQPVLSPRSRAVAIPIEILSPVGGAGCFYQRRTLTGVIIVAGSLIAGGTMLWGITHGDRDATIINAVSYGLLRGAGIFLAAQPTAVLPAEGEAAPPRVLGPAGRSVGLSPRFSF